MVFAVSGTPVVEWHFTQLLPAIVTWQPTKLLFGSVALDLNNTAVSVAAAIAVTAASSAAVARWCTSLWTSGSACPLWRAAR